MTGLALAAETSRPAKFSAADVAVVIVTYNRVVELRRCLASLQRQHPGIGQVTVFDNASSDGTDEMVRTEYPWVRLVTSPENLGACVARNEAARGSTEALIWFLDSDTEVVELDGGGRMAALFDGSDVAAVGGEAVVTARGRVIGVKRLRLTPNALVQGDLILADEPEVSHCDVIASCNLMVRRSDFEAASGFDPFYFFFYEDMDLTWRLSNKGRTLLALSSMPVIHRYSDSARIRRIWPESRNRTYFIIKNFGWARLLILPALDVAQMIRTDSILRLLRRAAKSSDAMSLVTVRDAGATQPRGAAQRAARLIARMLGRLLLTYAAVPFVLGPALKARALLSPQERLGPAMPRARSPAE
jgi:GT2 family glycosyltransferase